MNTENDYDDIFVGDTTAMVPARPLFRDMFIHPEAQVENVRRWSFGRGTGFAARDIDKVADQLAELDWPQGRLTVLTLVPYLPTVQQTVEALWACARQAQPSGLLLGNIKTDPKRLWLAKGIEHQPGLRWEIINLGAYQADGRGVSPIECRDTNSAHAGVLAAAAHFPLWVQAMAGNDVPPVWIPGYQVRTGSFGDLTRTIHLGWRPLWGSGGDNEPSPWGITLDASLSDARTPPWAGPIITWSGPLVKPTSAPRELNAGNRAKLALSA